MAAILALFGPAETESAVANGDTRTITLHHIHTGENIVATFRRDGQYDPAVLRQLNHFLRDWRNNAEISMDPQLFDVIWETYRLSGSRQPVQVVSAYRSPATNAMLRRRTEGVAQFSQHMLGKAMDQHYVDVPMSKIREIGMHLEAGGVGYYPTSGIPFVHLDVGHVRYWPRMSYAQLSHMFPDGKAVFKAADGRTLPRYREALAEVNAGGHANEMVAEAAPQKSIFSSLFGWSKPSAAPASAVASAQIPLRRDRALASAPVRVQVASAEAPVLAPASYEPDAPLPPRRPSEFAALASAMADAPLPPERPVQVASLAPTAGMRPPAPERGTDLPSIITRGTAAQAGSPGDGDALAYAEATMASESAQPPRPPVRPSSFGLAKAVGLRAAASRAHSALVPGRLDRSNFQGLTASRTLARARVHSTFGSTILPMRAAARLDVVSVAFASQALCPTRFGSKVRGPVSGSFSGPAVQPIETVASLN